MVRPCTRNNVNSHPRVAHSWTPEGKEKKTKRNMETYHREEEAIIYLDFKRGQMQQYQPRTDTVGDDMVSSPILLAERIGNQDKVIVKILVVAAILRVSCDNITCLHVVAYALAWS